LSHGFLAAHNPKRAYEAYLCINWCTEIYCYRIA
jgi:hypothetical protein